MKTNFKPNKKQIGTSAADVGLVAGGFSIGSALSSFVIKKNTAIVNLVGLIVAWYASMVVVDEKKVSKLLEGLAAYYGVRLLRAVIVGDGQMNGLGAITDKIPQKVREIAAKILPNLGSLNEAEYYDDRANYYLPALAAQPLPSSFSQPSSSPMSGLSDTQMMYNLAGMGDAEDMAVATVFA